MLAQYSYIDHEALGYSEEDIIPGVSWHNGDSNNRQSIAQVYDPVAYQEWLTHQWLINELGEQCA